MSRSPLHVSWSSFTAVVASLALTGCACGSTSPPDASNAVDPSPDVSLFPLDPTVDATSDVGDAAGGSTGALDPVARATPTDPTVATDFEESVRFLSEGDDPIQRDVRPGALDSTRIAVLRGVVRARAGAGLAGIRIELVDHPELGWTVTRPDGGFELAVNGGLAVRVRATAPGYLPAERLVSPPSHEFDHVADIAMVAVSPLSTMVSFAETGPPAIAAGPPETDAQGTRRNVMFVPAGTRATLAMPDGTRSSASTLRLRMTEYTVGEDGPAAMPGTLPPGSGYTYAVEISADEAVAVGARVEFSQPVANYVDNFLGYPVGTAIPSGYYDTRGGFWVAEEDGAIVQILEVRDGLAVLRVTQEERAALPAELLELGISDDERRSLAATYPVGVELWRFRLEHLSAHDYNCSFRLPPDAVLPEANASRGSPDSRCERSGSIIECESASLGERIPLAGTHASLDHRSRRMAASTGSRTIEMQLTDSDPPASASRVTVTIDIAGQHVSRSYAVTPNLRETFMWDGLDGYGREIVGVRRARVTIGYVYPGTTMVLTRLNGRSFGARGGLVAASAATRIQGSDPRTATGVREFTVDLTNEQGLASDALGGFSLSTHHVFDPASQTLFGGDGSVTAPDGDRVRRLLGGGSSTMPLLDGATVDPTTIALGYSTGLEFDVGPDGQLYAISGGAFYRLDLRGSATRLSVGPPESAGDNVSGLTVANDGTIYAATSSHVFRFDPTATATERWVIIAGLDWGRTEGDACADQRACVGRAGMTARARSFYRIDDLEWAPDGDLYVAHEFASNESELLVLHPNGTMDSIGGAAAPTRAFVRGSARDVGFGLIEDVAIGRDGSVYIASTNPSTLDTRGATYSRLTKLQADGTIEVIAGGGSDACALSRECDYYAPPGDPAVGFLTIRNVAVSADGTVYLVAAARGVESWVDVDGTIHGVQVFSLRDGSGLEPVLGDGTWGDYEGDPRAARSVPAYGIDNIDVLPDGNLAAAIVGGTYSSPMSLLVSLDGGARTGADGSVYWLARDPSGETRHVFDARGRHLRTERDPEGDLVRRFEYDERGRLVAEVDAYGLRTVIERDAAGVATAVVGPYGHRTELTIERGLLRRVVDPSGAVWTLQWNEAGLLSRFEDPVGAQNDFVYRESGELRSDSHSSGEGWTLESLRADSRIEATLTSREGRSTRYVVETGPSPSRSVIDSSGLVRQSRSGPGWTTTFLAPTGSQTMTELGVDQAWGAMWPLASSRTYSTPSGRTSTRVERTSYTFDGTPAPESVAQRTITSGSAGELWTSTYTEAARTHEIRSPEGRMLVVGLDGQGAAASVAAGSDVPTTFVRDSSGRVQTLSQGARSVAMEYDSDGSLRSVTDAVGATWAMGHDAVGRVVSLTQPSGAVTTLRRDLLGRIVGVTPPGHPEHSFERDARGRLTAEVTPDAGDGRARTVYEHDEDGLLTAIRRADGTSLVYGRDAGGRLVGLGVAEGDYGARYDTTTGNLVSVTNPSGDALTLEWDGDLMTSLSWSGAVSASLSVDYDSALRVSSAQLGSESPVLYRYDRDGLPVRVGAAELTRGADTARPARMTIGDLSFVYDHSEYGEVTRRSTSLAGTTLYEELLTRDAGGRVVGARETVRGAVVSRDYRYDSSGRLERVATGGLETERYRYDANGHREGASVDARDRVTAYVGVTYDYAITGERVRRVEGGRTTEYDYDEQGQLRAVVLSDGRQLTYGIDPQGRRGSRSMDGAVSERYLWAGDRLLAVLEPDGRIRDRFVYAENHVPTYFVRGGRTYAFVTDVRGSVRLVVDAATGAVAQELSYDAFGRVLSDSNPGFQPFGFAAGLYDAATGLVRFGMRDYDPELGEWTAPDPIGFLGGDPNLYRYCGGDPVNLVDPTGLDPAHDAIMEVFENADYSVPGIAGSVATALSGGAALAMFLFFLPEEAVGAAAVVGVWLVRAIMSGLAGWIGSQTGSEVKEMCLSGGLTRRQEEAMRRLAEHYNGAPRPEIRSRINPEGVPGQFPPGAMIGRQVY